MTDRIVIVGFMACGKTTVGQELARQLGCTFVDLDSFIAEGQGRMPAEIIQADGEDSFRKIETAALGEVLDNHSTGVIALGGGTWTIEANRMLVTRQECHTVWLNAPFETCWQRIIATPDNVRPMASDHNLAKRRYKDRRPAYELSEVHVATAGLDVNGIVNEIRERLSHLS